MDITSTGVMTAGTKSILKFVMISFTRTALNAYLANSVLGSPLLIPKNVETYDEKKKKYTGGIEFVKMPSHQAQLSLVSSSGMTVNPESLALTNNGTIILQDGLSQREVSMVWSGECDVFGWHFAGGSEHISRHAVLSETEITFGYEIHSGWSQHGIYTDLNDPDDISWKAAILYRQSLLPGFNLTS